MLWKKLCNNYLANINNILSLDKSEWLENDIVTTLTNQLNGLVKVVNNFDLDKYDQLIRLVSKCD